MIPDEQKIAAMIGELPSWRLEGREIVRDWQFTDFASALAFVNRVADLAESADHHPDILLHSWNRVRLRLTTHSENGLTAKDFSLARAIEQQQQSINNHIQQP